MKPKLAATARGGRMCEKPGTPRAVKATLPHSKRSGVQACRLSAAPGLGAAALQARAFPGSPCSEGARGPIITLKSDSPRLAAPCLCGGNHCCPACLNEGEPRRIRAVFAE